ncbi:TIM barrel protein [Sphingomicrobium sp. XHP0239]|uniref:sugar phosphate isomerase/epimerase family protein n=1 Tax=Sphingomicrobium maritimum TaxID=3133972 RepID=UPI0031CC5AFD
MIFAMSNIAWAPDERLGAYAALAEAGISGLEIAPGILFDGAEDPMDPDIATAERAMGELADHGLALVSMQSLLYGVEDAALFGDARQRQRFADAMHRAIDLAGRFAIPNVVFGSPRQRVIPKGANDEAAIDHAATTFASFADRAAEAGTVIAMEPNPAAYGTNFLTSLQEAIGFVAAVNHPALRLNFDLGAIIMNGDAARAADLARAVASHVHHVHVSEPDLAPAPADPAALAPVLAALAEKGYDRAVSIEMRRTDEGLAAVTSRIAALAQARKLCS